MNGEHTFHFTDKDYKSVLLDAIDQTSDRLLLETMNIDHLGDMEAVLDATLQARKRGAEVLMVYDRYSYPTVLLKHGQTVMRGLQAKMAELDRAGVTMKKVGARQLNPFAGRHHAKAVVADDTVFIGGGANLTHDTFATKDFMLRTVSPELAEVLFASLPTAALARPDDFVAYEDESSQLLIDGGQSKSSLIYETVCDLAKRASKAWYVSKLAPDGQLRELLEGIDTTYYYNTPKTASFFDSIAISIDQNRQPTKNAYGLKQELHAKFCVFEMPDGQFEAVSGSHNFNSRGVNFGTQEIALHSKDQYLAHQLLEFALSLRDSEVVHRDGASQVTSEMV